MKLATLTFSAAALVFCGLAQAQPPSANFTLTEGPALSDDGAPPPGPTTVGRWTGGSSSASWRNVPAFGEPSGGFASSDPVADFWREGFGNAAVSSVGGRLSAGAQVLPSRLSASVDVSRAALGDSGAADALWRRSFQLDPHASVTLSGIGSFDAAGASVLTQAYADPFDRECDPYRFGAIGGWYGRCGETLNDYHNFSAEGSEWGTLSFGGGFEDLDPDQLAGLDFQTLASARLRGIAHSTGENGELSITLTNHLEVVSTGYFSVAMGMWSVATVPEPDTYLGMLLGLGAVGGFARRRANHQGMKVKAASSELARPVSAAA